MMCVFDFPFNQSYRLDYAIAWSGGFPLKRENTLRQGIGRHGDVNSAIQQHPHDRLIRLQ